MKTWMQGAGLAWVIAAALVSVAACGRKAPGEPSADLGVDASVGLTKEEIRAVVEAHRMGVRRKCLDAVDAGDTAQWVIHVAVSDAGTVTNVASEGGDRAVAKCFDDEVSQWKFPRGPADFDIPLHFVKK